MRTILRQHADLSDVPHIVADTRTKNYTSYRMRSSVERNERGFWIETSTSGKPHNIVQESERSTQSAVLIVDLGVDVVPIGSGNGRCRGLKILLRPAPNLD